MNRGETTVRHQKKAQVSSSLLKLPGYTSDTRIFPTEMLKSELKKTCRVCGRKTFTFLFYLNIYCSDFATPTILHTSQKCTRLENTILNVTITKLKLFYSKRAKIEKWYSFGSRVEVNRGTLRTTLSGNVVESELKSCN